MTLTAVIISCLSSFPHLFSPSKTKQKPVWTPTDTYYQRLRSRLKAAVKERSEDHTLSSISSVPASPLPELGSKRSIHREQVQYAASYDSLEMEPETPEEIQRPHQTYSLVVPAMSRPSLQPRNFVGSFAGEHSDHDTRPPEKNHIIREMTYSITEEPRVVYGRSYRGQPSNLGKQEWKSRAFDAGSHKAWYTGSTPWGNALGT